MIFICLVLFKKFSAVTENNNSGLFFDRIFIVFFENYGFPSVSKNKDFSNLASKGLLLDNFFACTHPSQPNYICFSSGGTSGVVNNDDINLNTKNIFDLVEKKILTWRVYQEDYPGNCFLGDKGLYKRKHNPAISFLNIQNDTSRCSNIVSEQIFFQEIKNPSKLPNVMFYTPNMNNDGHDTSLSFAGEYLTNLYNLYLSKLPEKTLLVITWDEAGMDDYTNNRIHTILLGSMIVPNTVDSNYYSHPSLTRLIEENWQLGSLNNQDAKSAIMFPLRLVQNKQNFSFYFGFLYSLFVIYLIFI